jgi:NADH-quinone oxidoreductase subunit G
MATVRIHIDGEPVDVEAGTNLLMALLGAGHAVAHPCFHPSLSAPASCRMCLAAEEGTDGERLITTCNRSVQQGQRLSLQSAQVAAARSGVVEDMLLRHPADCAICERAGECEVQEIVYVHGDGTTKATSPGPREKVELGPHVVLDRERCILCSRCVRFEAEVSGTHGLSVSGSGAESVIDTCGAGPLEHCMSGNLLDLCPAGALHEPGELFRAPAWRMTGVSSTCAGCASGCVTRIDVADGRVQRVKPRSDGEDGQGYWLCDAGRWGWQEQSERLTGPQVRGNVVEWDAAFAEVAEHMEQARTGAVLMSPYLSNEEAFLLGNLALRWEADLYLWQATAAAGDQSFPSGFTISAERGPNCAGVQAVAKVLGLPLLDSSELSRRHAKGDIDALFAVGGSLHAEAPELIVPDESFLVVLDVQSPVWVHDAHVLLAGCSAWVEKEGTFIDRKGRLQRVRSAVLPPGEARPDFWILAALWHGGPNRDSPEQAFSRLAGSASEGPFAQLDYGALDSQHAAEGVAFGGGWTSLLQRRGLIRVEDHSKRR